MGSITRSFAFTLERVHGLLAEIIHLIFCHSMGHVLCRGCRFQISVTKQMRTWRHPRQTGAQSNLGVRWPACRRISMHMRSFIVFISIALSASAQRRPREQTHTSTDTVSQSLLALFDTYPLVAVGEWHDSQQDRDLRMRLPRQAGFADKVQNVVVECGNSLYQDALDRYVDAETVPREQLQRVCRDTTQSPVAGDDFSACESLIDEARSINRNRASGKGVQ